MLPGLSGPRISPYGVTMKGAPATVNVDVRVRQNFPETWLWDSINSGYENTMLNFIVLVFV